MLSVIENSAISMAIKDTINEIFIAKQIQFDIIVYGEMTFQIRDCLDEIRNANFDMVTRQVHIHKSQNWNHKLNGSAFIIITDYNRWLDFCNQTELDNEFYKPMRFLIYYLDSEVEDFYRTPFQRLFYFKGQLEHYSQFIINNLDTVALLNLEWFTAKSCNKAQPTIVNEFNKISLKWQKLLTINEKFNQFYGCLLTVDVARRYQHTHITLDGKPYGPIVDFFNAMAVRGNFTPNLQQIERIKFDHEVNYTLKRGTEYNFIPNIIISMPFMTDSKNFSGWHYSTLFYEETISFMLTPPEPYSQYEKLYLPFDAVTWVFFLIIFFYAFLSVLVINLISKRVQDVVYGTNVQSPYFNVIGTFFGVSQLKLPESNFARILLMTFILYCLVLRSAYQSLLFEYVASDMRKSSPNTIEDLYTNDFIIYGLEIAYSRLISMIPEDIR